MVLPTAVGELADEIRSIFLELERTLGPDRPPGECAPAIDVFESDEAVTVAADLPGVEPAALRVIAKDDLVLVAGEKRSCAARLHASFHLIERGFGRFVRTVTLTRACDTSQARATLGDGELRIVIPKLADRRGARIEIPIRVAGEAGPLQ